MPGTPPLREPVVDEKTGRLTPVWARYFTVTLTPNANSRLEQTSTSFETGSVPYVDGGFLVEDNTNFTWDSVSNLLNVLSIKISGLTPSRIIALDANGIAVSVADLAAWVKGTVRQITATSGGDGTVTLSTPQNIDTAADVVFKTITIGDSAETIISHNGADGSITTNEAAASDLMITCGANKTIELQNVVYDDWYFEIAPKTVGAGKPTLANYSGNINQWRMAVNDITELRPIEMAHKWKEGTEIEIHVHWGTNGVDIADKGVKWEIDYTWSNILAAGGTTAFAGATTVSVETLIPASTPHGTNMLTSVVSFTPTGGKIGATLLMSLKRIASVTNPTPTGDPWVFMVGVHYRIDTIGSRQLLVK